VVALAADLGRRRGLEDYIVETEAREASSGRSSPHDQDDRPVLRIAVAPVISPEKSLLRYFDLAVWLGDHLARRGDLLLRDSYAETNQLIREQGCDAALICTYSYVRLEREGAADLLVVPVVGGEITYHSVIIVPERSPHTDLLHLRGARFASADNLSTTGWLFPASQLVELGEDPSTFFSAHIITGSHDLAVAAVMNGDADAAALHSLVYSRMPSSTRKRLRIVLRSPPFGMPPVVAPAASDAGLKDLLRETLLEMHRQPGGAAILSRLKIDRFIIPPDDHFRSIEALVDRWESQQ